MEEVENSIAARVVAFIVTPVVTSLSAWLVVWTERILPGTPDLNDAEIAALAVAGAVAGGGACIQWIRNRWQWDKLKAQKSGEIAQD